MSDDQDQKDPALDKYQAAHGEPGFMHQEKRTVVFWDKGKGEEPHKIYDAGTLEELTLEQAKERGLTLPTRTDMKKKFPHRYKS